MRRTPNVFPETLPAREASAGGCSRTSDSEPRRLDRHQETADGRPVDATLAVAEHPRPRTRPRYVDAQRGRPRPSASAHGVSHDALQRAEDCRIGYGLIDSDVPDYGLGTLTDEDIATLEAEGHRLLAEHGASVRDALAKRLSYQVVSMAMTADRDRILGLADRIGGEPMRALVEHVAEAAEATLFPQGRYRHRVPGAALSPWSRTSRNCRRPCRFGELCTRLDTRPALPTGGGASAGRANRPRPRPGSPCGAA